MAKFTRLVAGVLRSFEESGGSLPAIYDQAITVVASGAGANQINGPVTAGTAITLPSSGTYTVSSGVTSLSIYLNGNRLDYVFDWNTSGSGPNYTQFQLTFDLVVGDRLDLRAERNT